MFVYAILCIMHPLSLCLHPFLLSSPVMTVSIQSTAVCCVSISPLVMHIHAEYARNRQIGHIGPNGHAVGRVHLVSQMHSTALSHSRRPGPSGAVLIRLELMTSAHQHIGIDVDGNNHRGSGDSLYDDLNAQRTACCSLPNHRHYFGTLAEHCSEINSSPTGFQSGATTLYMYALEYAVHVNRLMTVVCVLHIIASMSSTYMHWLLLTFATVSAKHILHLLRIVAFGLLAYIIQNRFARILHKYTENLFRWCKHIVMNVGGLRAACCM